MKDSLSEDTAMKLERISGILWEAMQSTIKNRGHCSLSLYLEGSTYDLREIIEKADIV